MIPWNTLPISETLSFHYHQIYLILMPTYQAVPWSLLTPQQGQRHWATWSKVKQLLQQRGSFLDLGSRHKTHKSLYFYTTTLGFQSKPSLLLIKGNTEHPIPRESKTSEVFCFFFFIWFQSLLPRDPSTAPSGFWGDSSFKGWRIWCFLQQPLLLALWPHLTTGVKEVCTDFA